MDPKAERKTFFARSKNGYSFFKIISDERYLNVAITRAKCWLTALEDGKTLDRKQEEAVVVVVVVVVVAIPQAATMQVSNKLRRHGDEKTTYLKSITTAITRAFS
jgi:hypothetical protein